MNQKAMVVGAIVVVIMVIAAAVVALNWNSDDTQTSDNYQYELEYSYYLKQETDTDLANCWNGSWGILYNNGKSTLYEFRIFITNVGETTYSSSYDDFGIIDLGSSNPDRVNTFTMSALIDVQPGETKETYGIVNAYEFGGLVLNPEKANQIHATEVEYVSPDPTRDVFKSEFEVGDYYIVAVTATDWRMGYTEPSVNCHRVEIKSVNDDGTYDTGGSVSRDDETLDELLFHWGIGVSEETVQQNLDSDAQTFVYNTYLGPRECYSVTVYEAQSGYESTRTFIIGTEPVNGYYPVYSWHWENGWWNQLDYEAEYVVLYSSLIEPLDA